MGISKYNWIFYFMLMLNLFKAQTNSTIQFHLTYNSKPLVISDSSLPVLDSAGLQISDLKFYCSKIQFLKNKKVVFEEKNSFHLVDASNSASQKINVTLTSPLLFDELVFNLGIDSITSLSGALGGDLDPTKGMYWTWQSGYINFKIEGKSKQCKSRNNEFQFHLGGYAQPNYCLERLVFSIREKSVININADVKKIIEQLKLNQQTKIMLPSKDAVLLSKKISACFEIVK